MIVDFLKLKFCSFRSSIDATNDSSSLAMYVNDSPACYSNAVMKRVVFKNKAHLCLFSLKVALKLGIYEDIFTILE